MRQHLSRQWVWLSSSHYSARVQVEKAPTCDATAGVRAPTVVDKQGVQMLGIGLKCCSSGRDGFVHSNSHIGTLVLKNLLLED
jgi:hypothetical protein